MFGVKDFGSRGYRSEISRNRCCLLGYLRRRFLIEDKEINLNVTASTERPQPGRAHSGDQQALPEQEDALQVPREQDRK